jgi:RNA polymerase sigma-70 factor (ECF subfamily)
VPELEHSDASTDELLVLAARSGDRAAVARLYERFAPVIHGVLMARLSQHATHARHAGHARHDADDLTHDVFLAAMAALPSLRDPAAVGPWLCQAARNRAANFRRSWWRRVWPGVPDRASEARDEDPGVPERAKRVLAVVRELPEAYRETLTLRLVEGLTGPQIAERTGMTHGSVRVNLTRGMAMLRSRLEGVS